MHSGSVGPQPTAGSPGHGQDHGSSAAADGDSTPSAKPVMRGYENIAVDNTPLPPPPPSEDTRRREDTSAAPALNSVLISEAEARSALLQVCKKHFCYGKRAAENMTVTWMGSTSAYHYILESFCESRTTYWACFPYRSGQVDGPSNGPAPKPWDIAVKPEKMFEDSSDRIEIPHTAYVEKCQRCHGTGNTVCSSCSGLGQKKCTYCNNGYTTSGDERRVCSTCNGLTRVPCSFCRGDGRTTCSNCSGCCQVKWYIEMKVKWNNHADDYVLDRTAMPDKKIRKVQGMTMFQEEMPRVFPVSRCPEQAVNQASAELVAKHQTLYSTTRILMQRHNIRVVPVTQVNCDWKAKKFTFFIYGLEKKVYCHDYPQKSCWGCSIA